MLEHLRRSAGLLADWRADPALVSAGLYHAVYDTDGFDLRHLRPEPGPLPSQLRASSVPPPGTPTCGLA